MRIAALMPELAVNSLYRTLVPMQALAHRGHAVHIEERNEIRNPERLLEADLVHFLRFSHAEMLRMARRLKAAGVAMVWDNDDDLTAIPRENPAFQQLGGLRGQYMFSRMTAMMKLADVVTTPSEVLAARYAEASGTEVRVLENYLPPTFARPERVMPHPGVAIGWLAALEHQVDFEQLRLRETLERLMARHPHVTLITIGLNLGLNRNAYGHYPITRYGALPELMSQFDIGLAPLIDIPFNRARSNVKVKEYAAMGVPWLASPVGPYAELGEEQGGRLVPDDRWYQEIEALITEREARARLAHRGRRWAQGHLIEDHIDAWEDALETAVAKARAASGAGR